MMVENLVKSHATLARFFHRQIIVNMVLLGELKWFYIYYHCNK